MAIASAEERGTSVYVYDENNNQMFSKSFSPSPGAGLKGYTSSTITIRSGCTTWVYDARGNAISSR